MPDIHRRVQVLEKKDIERIGEIQEIKTKIGHIEDQMDDLKTIAKTNTDANKKTNETLTDIHLFLMESKGVKKAILWVAGALATLTAMVISLLGIFIK